MCMHVFSFPVGTALLRCKCVHVEFSVPLQAQSWVSLVDLADVMLQKESIQKHTRRYANNSGNVPDTLSHRAQG